MDFEKELLRPDLAKFTLPDGVCVELDSERFRCAEPLFQPSLLHSDSQGIHELTFNAIMKCDEEIRGELFANIVLAGGSSRFVGFKERLSKELLALAPPATQINVVARQEPRFSAWLGGNQLASLNTFAQMSISKDEYDENGPAIVHRKCF